MNENKSSDKKGSKMGLGLVTGIGIGTALGVSNRFCCVHNVSATIRRLA